LTRCDLYPKGFVPDKSRRFRVEKSDPPIPPTETICLLSARSGFFAAPDRGFQKNEKNSAFVRESRFSSVQYGVRSPDRGDPKLIEMVLPMPEIYTAETGYRICKTHAAVIYFSPASSKKEETSEKNKNNCIVEDK